MNITPKQKEKLERLANVVNKGDIALLGVIDELEKKLEKSIDEIKESIPDFESIAETMKGKDGEDGVCVEPDYEYIISEILERIPKPKDGITPKINYKSIIDEVLSKIEKPKDGITPEINYDLIIEEVLLKIEIPQNGKDGSPDTAEQIRDKVESLEGDERIDKKAIKGLENIIDKPHLDKAISILDKRTEYLVNKTVKHDNSLKGSGTSNDPLIVNNVFESIVSPSISTESDFIIPDFTVTQGTSYNTTSNIIDGGVSNNSFVAPAIPDTGESIYIGEFIPDVGVWVSNGTTFTLTIWQYNTNDSYVYITDSSPYGGTASDYGDGTVGAFHWAWTNNGSYQGTIGLLMNNTTGETIGYFDFGGSSEFYYDGTQTPINHPVYLNPPCYLASGQTLVYNLYPVRKFTTGEQLRLFGGADQHAPQQTFVVLPDDGQYYYNQLTIAYDTGDSTGMAFELSLDGGSTFTEYQIVDFSNPTYGVLVMYDGAQNTIGTLNPTPTNDGFVATGKTYSIEVYSLYDSYSYGILKSNTPKIVTYTDTNDGSSFSLDFTGTSAPLPYGAAINFDDATGSYIGKQVFSITNFTAQTFSVNRDSWTTGLLSYPAFSTIDTGIVDISYPSYFDTLKAKTILAGTITANSGSYTSLSVDILIPISIKSAGASSVGINSISFGNNSFSGDNSITFGSSSIAINSGIAIGAASHATGYNSLALGTSSQANQLFGTSIGYSMTNNGTQSVAIGLSSTSSYNNAISFWYGGVNYFVCSSGVSTFNTPLVINGSLTLSTTDMTLVSTNGAIGYDISQKTFAFRASNMLHYGAGIMFSQYANGTCANTTTETTISSSIIGRITIPISYWSRGKVYKVSGTGYRSAVLLPNFTLRFYIGSTVILTTGTITSTNATNGAFQFEGIITCQSITTTTANLISQGSYREGNIFYDMVNTSAVTVATDSILTMKLTAQWGTASASNTITLTNLYLQTIA